MRRTTVVALCHRPRNELIMHEGSFIRLAETLWYVMSIRPDQPQQVFAGTRMSGADLNILRLANSILGDLTRLDRANSSGQKARLQVSRDQRLELARLLWRCKRAPGNDRHRTYVAHDVPILELDDVPILLPGDRLADQSRILVDPVCIKRHRSRSRGGTTL